MNDQEFMCELIDIFLDDSPTQVENLRQAIADRNSSSVADSAHRLKGACSNIGADSLANLCGRLEKDGRADQDAGFDSTLESVEDEFKRVTAYLDEVKQGQA